MATASNQLPWIVTQFILQDFITHKGQKEYNINKRVITSYVFICLVIIDSTLRVILRDNVDFRCRVRDSVLTWFLV